MGPGLPDVERILVVHIRGGLGDVLLSTPVLEALRRRYATARIDMMVRSGAVAMVAHHPVPDEVLIVEDGDLDRRRGFSRWLREIRARRYSMGIVLWSRFSEAWLIYRAGIRHRVGQDSRITYSWTYTRRVKVRSEHGDEKSHWVECQLDYARAVGADLDDPFPRLYLGEDARREAVAVLRRRGLQDADPFVVLHVGRGTPLDCKRLPLAPFSAIADALAGEWNAPVLLTGGESERDAVVGVAEGMRKPAVPLAGQLTVAQLGGVLERATVVVANDSGPMHMAAGLEVPTVGIFAMEKDRPSRWGPLGTGNEVVRPQRFRCRPDCLKETCPRMSCYEDITPDMVVAAARRAVERHG